MLQSCNKNGVLRRQYIILPIYRSMKWHELITAWEHRLFLHQFTTLTFKQYVYVLGSITLIKCVRDFGAHQYKV